MSETFNIDPLELQPSQLYLQRDKVDAIRRLMKVGGRESIKAVPVKWIRGKLTLTDGHSRVFVAFELGHDTIRAQWEIDDLNWKAYETCVDWCLEVGVLSIADLVKRVISEEDYRRLWLDRCQSLHERPDSVR